MEKLEELGVMFKIDNTLINSLWYCDDTTLIANSIENAKTNIKILKSVAREFGLEINESKSKALLFGCNDGVRVGRIEGVEVVEKLTYLGLEVGAGRDIFKGQREAVIKKADSRVCRLQKEIETSYNKLDVGKMWWKCGVMPCLLMGAGVINLNEDQIKHIQRVENRVFRQLLGGTGDCPVAILRGEVGASLVRTRVVQARLMLTKSIIDSENSLLKTILSDIRRVGEGRWNQLLNIYLQDVGLTFSDLETLSKAEVWRKVRAYDNMEWFRELDALTDRDVYKTFRKSVGGSWGYDNSFESELLFQARSNTLRLNAWNRHGGGVVGCELCGDAYENLKHFLLDCPSLSGAREERVVGRVRCLVSDVDKIGQLLFDKSIVHDVKKMIGKLWFARCSRLGRRWALRPGRGGARVRVGGATGVG